MRCFLDEAAARHNQLTFIADDPIAVPRQFSLLQDIEIIGFWTAMLAWGQRPVILQKARQLVQLMDGAPFDFIKNHQESDRKPFLDFKHRTFNADDTLYFLAFFQDFYQQNDSLETAFVRHLQPNDQTVENALVGFEQDFFRLSFSLLRTRKHVASPRRKSSCKRLNMFLRWMVRSDEAGVDLGVWKKINASQLLMPLDVHVDRQARRLGLLVRPQTDWLAVLELTENLRKIDAADPVRYDFALFGLGIEEKNINLNFRL